MPTKKQLLRLRETDFELFGGNPDIIGYPEDKNHEDFSGTIIGKIEYDPGKKDLKVIVNEKDTSTKPLIN